ncbi:uncharacterized protein EDB93DRAFT_1324392 [Suillus bovinus]|uniref:uncharacterized protein n=1 Tax=Suillus bovinus TaxID=48563 RepID=UPI001B85D7F2|nr:uncharacterized protein EDB93DRAFT_1324392 [Suillus bovinus]KAG2159880.1 hypothetical protein EDB93DRAFT_1324392 [Suillus bovinus]
MPNRADPGHSPSDDKSDFKADLDDDPTAPMSDIALRKKKNADAQAAFRQRRANYIATLEETVTSLESVVLQLQDSCREARSESGDLRQDNARLRHELREREKFWRALWQTRKTGQAPESDDLPPLPSSFTPHSQQTNINNRTPSSHGHYSDDSMGYQTGDDTSNSLCSSSYTSAPNHSYATQSPALSYTAVETEQIPSGGSGHHMNARVSRYSSYPYPMQPINRDGQWTHNVAQTTSANGSPTLTSPDVYANRPFEEQKNQLNHLETTPYIFPGSRSISPTSSTPPSSSSTSLTSPFQFTFPADGPITQDRAEFDYRRHSNTHGADLTLHGGTADISLPSAGGDGVRYRLGPRRANSGPTRTALITSGGASEGEATPYSKLRQRRGRSRESRSPSPGAPPISGTLAVIKAQAFGALRRTRTRTKKSSEGAAKVAMEVLEARGIGMGVAAGSKRPRLHHDDSDMQT